MLGGDRKCLFDFEVEGRGCKVQYKHDAQSLRFYDHHSEIVSDAHRAGANRL